MEEINQVNNGMPSGTFRPENTTNYGEEFSVASTNNHQAIDKSKPHNFKPLIIAISLIVIITFGIAIVFLINSGKSKTYNGTIYNGTISSLKLKYYEGYNIATGDAISDTIPLNEVDLAQYDLEKVSSLIYGLTKINIDNDSEEYGHLIYDHIFDYYELDINNDVVIYIGDEYGVKAQTDDYFKVPEELFSKLKEIAKAYSEDNLYQTIGSDNVTIIHGEDRYDVTDTDQKATISNYNYYVLKTAISDEVAYELDLHDGRVIELFRASVIGRIRDENNTYIYIYAGGLENYIDKIFNNRSIIISEDFKTILVTYGNQDATIDNKEKIEELRKKFSELDYLDYSQPYYIQSMSNEDFYTDEYIVIHVGGGKYIIPSNRTIVDRYYIDEDNNIYSVSGGLYKDELEKYFRDLVGAD